ncbi:MAG: pentapeptide repeat-containing protein [Pseudomonadota bacterium]
MLEPKSENEERVLRQKLSNASTPKHGCQWPAFFVPMFDPTGNIEYGIINTRNWHLPDFLKINGKYEGLIVPASMKNPPPVPVVAASYDWCYWHATPPNSSNLNNCLINSSGQLEAPKSLNNSIFIGSTSIKSCPIAQLNRSHIFGDLRLSSSTNGIQQEALSPNIDIAGSLVVEDSIRERFTVEKTNGVKSIIFSSSAGGDRILIQDTENLHSITFSQSSQNSKITTKAIEIKNASGLEFIKMSSVLATSYVEISGLKSLRNIAITDSNMEGFFIISDCYAKEVILLNGIEIGSLTIQNVRVSGSFMFRGSRVLKRAYFGTKGKPFVVDDAADFSSTNVENPATFDFVDFSQSTFLKDCDFSNRVFSGRTIFDETIFSRTPLFHGAVFHQNTSFREAVYNWEKTPEIKGSPGFHLRNPPRDTRIWFAFNIIKPKLRLRKLFGKIPWCLRKPFVRIRAEIWYKIYCIFYRRTLTENNPAIRARNTKLGDTERAFRTLRQAMEGIKAQPQAAVFNEHELRARYARFHDKSVPPSEKVAGLMFGLLSQYGNSLMRPVAGILILGVIVTPGYMLMSDWNFPASIALSVSLTMMLRPFLQFSPIYGRAAKQTPSSRSEINEVPGTSPLSETQVSIDSTFDGIVFLIREQEFLFKFVSFAQSLGAVVLLFLLGLALRRKFQLN